MRLSKSSPAASILGILTGRGRDCVIRIGWPSGSCQPVLTDALRISQVRRSYTSHGHPDGQRTEGERAIWNALPLRQARNNSSCDAARREDACRQPIKPLVNAIFALELGANNFRDILRQILDGLDTAQHSHHADTCNDCIFWRERAPNFRPIRRPNLPVDSFGQLSLRARSTFYASILNVERAANVHRAFGSKLPLVVEPQEVVLGQAEPANRCLRFYPTVGPVPVVLMQPDRQLFGAPI